MSDVKKEELAPNQFICKICWKVSKDIKFRITVSDCDMGSWSNCGEGFSICDDCFNDLMSVIDTKTNEIMENMIESVSKYPDCKRGAYTLNSIIERRLGELNKLNNRLKELIAMVKEEKKRAEESNEKGGGDREKDHQD